MEENGRNRKKPAETGRNVQHGAENVWHGAKNMRHAAKKCAKCCQKYTAW